MPAHFAATSVTSSPLDTAAASLRAAQQAIDLVIAKMIAQPIEHNPHDLIAPPSPPTDIPIGMGRFRGVVKSFHPERGFGWMSCPKVGRDVFVHANDLQTPESRHMLPFLPGTTLEFDIEQRPRGLSAINVAVVSVPAAPASEARGQGKQRGDQDHLMSSRPIAMGRRFQGTVVYYTSSKGYGFVQSSNLAGKVYVHIYAVEKFNVTELRPGMVLEFGVRENHKGKYACNVKLIRDMPKSDKHQHNGDTSVVPTHAVTMWEGRYRGVLKSFDSKRSLGWIQYRNTEVFMHIYEVLQDNAEDRLHLGAELEFSIGTHGRGPTAYDIDILGVSAPETLPAAQPLGSSYVMPSSASQSSDDDDGAITPPPEACHPPTTPILVHSVAPQIDEASVLIDGLKRLGLMSESGLGRQQQQRPKVSLTTVALLAQLLEASGIDTVADTDEHFRGSFTQSSTGASTQQDDDDCLSDILRYTSALDEAHPSQIFHKGAYW